MSQHPNSWQIEGRFVPIRALSEVITLRRALIDNGTTPAVASGIVGWLFDKQHDGIDRTGPHTRARYRRELQRLSDSIEAGRCTIPGYLNPATSVA